jgi:alpha-L-rhamnosidase
MTNLTFAKATDTYILKGEGEEIFEPRFTYHGFRYVEIIGYPGKPKAEYFTGCVAHSNLQRTGSFWCNDEMINQVYKNTYWGQRANFMSVPTDCPQRAERLGWTGDMFIYTITAAYNMDTAAYYTKWMKDILDAQTSYGAFSDVAPRVVVLINGAPGWGDIGIMLPYVMLKLYSDYRLIEQCYEQMVQWMNYIQEGNPDFLRTKRRGHDYGDWLSYNADTPTDVLSTAIWALDAIMMMDIAKTLGKTKDQNKYDQLFQNIKTAFNREYVQSDGTIKRKTQTIYLFALLANLLDNPIKEKAISHLIQDIKSRDHHLSTGFLGTPYLLPILTETDHLDTAYQILNQEDCPSWKYMVKQGATTIWERWDSDVEMDRILKKSSMPSTYLHHRWGDIKMNNSYNHFALGSVVEWIYRYMAGIDYDPNNPGFKHIYIKPHPGNGITHVQCSYRSLYGIISTEWKIQGTDFQLDLQIPVNTEATLVLPTTNSSTIREKGQPLNAHKEIKTIEKNKGKIAVKIGSGSYHFVVTNVKV